MYYDVKLMQNICHDSPSWFCSTTTPQELLLTDTISTTNATTTNATDTNATTTATAAPEEEVEGGEEQQQQQTAPTMTPSPNPLFE